MARQKKLTPEQEKEIKLLQANNEMLEKTKEEAKLRGKEKSVQRIELAQQDVITQIAKIDTDIAKEMVEDNTLEKKKETKTVKVATKLKNTEESVFDKLNEIKKNTQVTTTVKEDSNTDTQSVEVITPKVNTNVFNDIPNDIQYDIISLPSNGECYPGKIGRLPVSYLTAYDENFLTSPNLYQDGLVIDYLLKNKILDKNFDVDNMIDGDADAVVLFLRATSYGADFPVSVRDPESGERFDTTVDLTTFKNKEFKLKGDENGLFSFTLPLSKDVIKFKYLTRGEEKNLRLITELERKNGRTTTIRSAERQLRVALGDDDILSDNERENVASAIDTLSKWIDKIDDDDSTYISKIITNRMEMCIMEVNGNTDKKYISSYIKNMPVRDSFAFRKYLSENEPGVDWSITVQRPESLGGGSFDTFLTWDDTVFFNISEG